MSPHCSDVPVLFYLPQHPRPESPVEMAPTAVIGNSVEEAMAALDKFNIEAFTLLSLGIAITALRLYARITHVGWKGLWADDYLVVVGIFAYVSETVMAYCVGNKAGGLANNSMTDEQRAALHPSDPEYQTRVLGSKIQVSGWASYLILLWALKGAMCTFYLRLTRDLKGYRPRINIGFAFISISFCAVMLNLLLGCRPLHRMWQIYPNPGRHCQPDAPPAVVFTTLSLNVATDLYLIGIPMPMLFKATMPLPQRVRLVALFSCGLFVIIAAILRVVFLVTDPINGPQQGGSWSVRETFVAVLTTNLPMLFPYIKRCFSPVYHFVKRKTTPRSRGSSKLAASSSGASSRFIEHEDHATNATDLEILGRKQGPIEFETVSIPWPAVIERRLEVIVEEGPIPETRGSKTRSGNYTVTWSDNATTYKTAERSDYFADHVHQSAYNTGYAHGT